MHDRSADGVRFQTVIAISLAEQRKRDAGQRPHLPFASAQLVPRTMAHDPRRAASHELDAIPEKRARMDRGDASERQRRPAATRQPVVAL